MARSSLICFYFCNTESEGKNKNSSEPRREANSTHASCWPRKPSIFSWFLQSGAFFLPIRWVRRSDVMFHKPRICVPYNSDNWKTTSSHAQLATPPAAARCVWSKKRQVSVNLIRDLAVVKLSKSKSNERVHLTSWSAVSVTPFLPLFFFFFAGQCRHPTSHLRKSWKQTIEPIWASMRYEFLLSFKIHIFFPVKGKWVLRNVIPTGYPSKREQFLDHPGNPSELERYKNGN